MTFNWASIHNQTLHGKLLRLIVATCCGSMLVAGLALFGSLTFELRQSFERDSRALAETIAANCNAAVAFGDTKPAMEVMHSLDAQNRVVGAMIRLPNGATFVKVGLVDDVWRAGPLKIGGTWVKNSKCIQACPIIVRGETVGTLVMVSDFGPAFLRLFKSYVLALALTAAGAVFLGLALAARARRFISDPIRSLADSIRSASANQNFAVRASQSAGGEVGQLAEAFNGMLDRVEKGEALAREVAERRRVEAALRESEERFRSLFQNAIIGLYRISTEGRFVMANQALINLLGYSTFEELAALDIKQQVCVVPEYHTYFIDCVERFRVVEANEVQWRRRDGKIIHVRESAKAVCNADGAVLWYEGCVEDITARQEASTELQRLNRGLIDASRAAGMAEVATGVLHNVGNVLNSVSVSAQLVYDQMGSSKVASLQQAVVLLGQNLPRLASFLAEDPRGKLLPNFLIKVTQHIAVEQNRWHEELRQLKSNIEHMKEIVAMQQGYARVSGLVEPLSAKDLLEDALRMNHAGLERHKIHVERDYSDVPNVMVDKHKVLQILINLIRNAKYAMDDAPVKDRRLGLKVCINGTGRVKIHVQDNGVGISKDNLTRIFSHGFTTRRDGHGFGLHSGALAARELGGTLAAQSDGPGLGATFTLELPVARANN